MRKFILASVINLNMKLICRINLLLFGVLKIMNVFNFVCIGIYFLQRLKLILKKKTIVSISEECIYIYVITISKTIVQVVNCVLETNQIAKQNKVTNNEKNAGLK